MIMSRQPSALPARPASGWWWIGLLTATLFAFQVNYVRIHLLTEVHHRGESATSAPHPGDHQHDAQAGNDHHQQHHQPHSADDHELQLTGKRLFPANTIALLLPETSFHLTSPKLLMMSSPREPAGFPGESPPDPRQPRAPPTV
jgi:hypothetical protein